MIQSIALIGAGKLATQLGKAFQNAGLKIVQVYSRTEKSAKELADLLDCPWTTKLAGLATSDLVLISVKDDALEAVLEQIQVNKSILVHTAGSVPIEILEMHAGKYGVFYPLQTFSKKRDIDFSEIPVCLEANIPEVYQELEQLAGHLSKTVAAVNSEKRKVLHLAAVFTCNFVNHFYQIGNSLLGENELDFDLLKPLIRETAQKVMVMNPMDVQTGPAVRFDETIINTHLDLLSDKTELKKIYRLMSEHIYNTQHKNQQDDIF